MTGKTEQAYRRGKFSAEGPAKGVEEEWGIALLSGGGG